MPSFTVIGNSGVARTLGSGETGIVPGNSSLVTASTSAVTVGPLSGCLLVAGVVATTAALESAVQSAGTLRLDVTMTGAVTGTRSALEVTSGSALVSNGGTLSGGSVAINFDGTVLTFVNSGTVVGNNSSGVYADTSGGLKVTNSGDIAGSSFGIYSLGTGVDIIANTGTISGGLGGMWLSDANGSVTNAGLIAGTVSLNGGADLFDGTTGVQSVVQGGDGADTIRGGAQAETLRGDADNDLLRGGGGEDSLVGDAGLDRLHGGTGEDTMSGGTDGDQLYGWADDDRLVGDAGSDSLWGGAGDDSLVAGDGNDRLIGGIGDDTLSGGTGIDTFVFRRGEGTDRISAFTNDTDKIDLSDFGFANSAAVIALASNVGSGLRIDLPGEGSLFVQGLNLAIFNINDLIL